MRFINILIILAVGLLFYFVSPRIISAVTYDSRLFDTKEKAQAFACNDKTHEHIESPVKEKVTYRQNQEIVQYQVTCTDRKLLPPEKEEQPRPSSEIGTITPPDTIPTIEAQSGDPSAFVAGLIRASLRILIISAFIIALVWMMFAGYRFIFAGGDPKTIASAWSQIYWGLFGLVIVLGAFAIIRLAEIFFGVRIISGEFQIPQR